MNGKNDSQNILKISLKLPDVWYFFPRKFLSKCYLFVCLFIFFIWDQTVWQEIFSIVFLMSRNLMIYEFFFSFLIYSKHFGSCYKYPCTVIALINISFFLTFLIFFCTRVPYDCQVKQSITIFYILIKKHDSCLYIAEIAWK